MALLLLAAGLFLVSNRGRDFVIGTLTSILASQDTYLRYATLSGAWPRSLLIDGLVVSDRAGPWLEARRVAIAWRPVELFRGRLGIKTLDIEAPLLHRMPQARSERGAGAFPLDLVLDSFRLTKGQMIEPVAARFAAEGALRLDDEDLSVRLLAKRLDGVDEHIALTARYREDGRVLAIDVDAVSPEGGLVGALLGWRQAPGFAIKAKGEGPALDWRLNLQGDFGDAGALALQGHLAWGEAINLRLNGRAELGARYAAPRLALGERLTFDGSYTRAHDRDTGALNLTSETLRVNLEIARSEPDVLGRRALSGSGAIRSSGRIIWEAGGYQLGASTIDATFSGTDSEPAAELRLALSDVGAHALEIGTLGGKLLLALRTLPGGRALVVDGEGKAGQVARVADSAEWSVSGHLSFDGRDSELKHLTIDGDGLFARANGHVRSASSYVEADLVSRKLEALTSLLGVNLAGSGDFRVAARRGKANTAWAISVKGTIENGIVDDVALAPFAGERLTLAAQAALSEGGALEIRSAEVHGAHLRARARGRVRPTLSLESEIDTDLAAIGAAADFEAEGPLTLSLNAEGSLDAPIISIAADSPQAAIEGLALGRLTLSFDARPTSPFPSGLIRLRSNWKSGDGEISAELSRSADGGYALAPLHGIVFGSVVEGALALSRDEVFTGHINARFGSLGPLLAFAFGVEVEGEGRGMLSVEFAAEPDVQATLDAAGVALGPRLTANVLKASYRRANHADFLSVDMRDGALAVAGGNPVDFGGLSLSMEGPSKGRRVTLEGQAVGDAHGSLKLAGTLRSLASGRQLSLELLEADLWTVPAHLLAPTTIVRTDDRFALSPMRVAIGAGEAEFAVSRTERSLDAALKFKSMPLALVGGPLGLDWPRGALDGTVSLSTAAPEPRGTLDLRLSEVALPAKAAAGAALAGRFSGIWNGRVLAFDGELTSAGAGSAVLDARLPLVADRTGALSFASDGALSGQARWKGRIGGLWTLLLLDNHRLDGDGELTLAASGTLRAPRLSGHLVVTGGSYDNLVTGTRLANLGLEVDANEDEVKLTASASDGASGTLSGQGSITLLSERGYPMDATMALKRFRLVGSDSVSATASGTASLAGPIRSLTLTGALSFERVDATVPDRLPTSIPTLPVTYVGLPESRAREAERLAEKESAVALEVDIEIPGRAYLRGRGLNAEWAGKLSLAGTTAVPQIKGEIGLVRGTLDFAGNVFDLTRGRVVFQGGEKIDPDLDVEAARNVRGTEVTLAVTGPFSAPRLAIQSVPSLPRDEAVALLLFGKPPAALSAFELVQVARGVATLTGAGSVGGVGLLGRAREALGLDVLSVGVGEMGATSVSSASALTESATVSAGRHISKKVYVGVTQGMSAASGTIELDVQLTPHISLNSRFGEVSGGVAGLDWKWDY
jgi:translocation and assembly module TamB